MVDLQDLGESGAHRLHCERAIFTSLPSRIGEGYRLVTWSAGLKPEERQELTRRAPSHGSLTGDADSPRGLVLFQLKSSGRSGWGFVRVSGAEHTRRGGGRVWTDFLLADPADAAREGLHPDDLRASLALEPPPKQPLGVTPLPRVGVVHAPSGAASSSDARAIASAAAVASWILAGRACVVAAGASAIHVLEDALSMIPAALRGGIEASAGLRFSPGRGVKVTLTDRIDQDTVRATRGQGVDCVDLAAGIPAPAGTLAPWFALISRWWSEERSGEAVALADKLASDWSVEQILSVASLCESIDRGLLSPEALHDKLSRRSAA